MCHLCCAVFTYLVSLHTVHGGWFIHVSSVHNSYFGSETRTVACCTTPIISWIALASVGLREVSEMVVWTKATDRAETCEILEERRHEVETE